jgi:hypothetical protein
MEAGAVYEIWPSLDLEVKVVFLQREARQRGTHFQKDAARYFAKNFRSDALDLRVALTRLLSHSTLTGTPVTLDSTKRICGRYFELRGPDGTADPFQKIFSGQHGKRQATSPREQLVKLDGSVIHSLTETREAQKITQARQKFEVNMREFERERLARLDVYERALEIRIWEKKRG